MQKEENNIRTMFESFCTNHYSPILVFPVYRNYLIGKIIYANKKAEFFFGDKKHLLKMRPSAIDANVQPTPILDELMTAHHSGHHNFRRTVFDKNGYEGDVLITLTSVKEGNKAYIFEEIDFLGAYEPYFSDEHKKLLELEKELKGVKTFKETITVCATCQKVKTRTDRWVRFEAYFMSNSAIRCSHGYCPVCIKKMKASMKMTPA